MTIPLLITVTAVMLTLLAQHYFPWQMLFHRPLPRLLAYVLGMLGVILPLSGLFCYWTFQPPGWIYAQLAALWAAAVSGGVTVIGAYALDALLVRLARAHELEELLRGKLDG